MNKEKVVELARLAGFSTGTLTMNGSPPLTLVQPVGSHCFIEVERLCNLVEIYTLEEAAKKAASHDGTAWEHDPAAVHVCDMVSVAIARDIREMKPGGDIYGR